MTRTKQDEGKPRFDLMPPRAELEVVRALTFGAVKHSPNGYLHAENASEVYSAANGRHFNAWRRGERSDHESGLHPLAHAIADLMMLLELEILNE